MTPESALHRLLLDFFTADDLRRWIRYDAAMSVIAEKLPGAPVAPAHLVETVVEEFIRHGLVDKRLFAQLRAERPRKRSDVERVEALWHDHVPSPPTASQNTARPSSTPSTTPLHSMSTPLHSLAVSTPIRAIAGPADPRDVAILVALKEEWEILWTIAGKPRGNKDPDSGRYLFRFEVASVSGRTYRCVALFIGEMGPGQATNAVVPLLRERPKVIVNVGIAAAIHDDLKLCDVVVADQVDDYLATVKAARARGSWEFQPRGSVYKTSHSLVQDVDSLKFADYGVFTEWQMACSTAAEGRPEMANPIARARREGTIREAPEIARVHLASGPVLAAAEAFSSWIRSRDGLMKALEMEAAGMMLAAHHQGEPTPTLVLRGISDYGDARKARMDKLSGGAFRYFAMANVTQLLWALMRHGILPRHSDSSALGGSGHPHVNLPRSPGVDWPSLSPECATLLADRPQGYEALVLFRLLAEAVDRQHGLKERVRHRIVGSLRFVEVDEVSASASGFTNELLGITRSCAGIMRALLEALEAPGLPDIEAFLRLSREYEDLYRRTLEATNMAQAFDSHTHEVSEIFELLWRGSSEMIREFEEYPRRSTDELLAVMQGPEGYNEERQSLEFTLLLSFPDGWTDELDRHIAVLLSAIQKV